jgi:3-hydroxyisobutyrate dehydrogenase
MQRVALLGLGIMGAGMAHNLLKAGYPLTVWNRTLEKARPLTDAGAQLAPTPLEAAKDADIVIGMVADDNASRNIWLGEYGALLGMKPGSIGIESSTLSMEWVRELHTAAAKGGVRFADAPVTGSKVAANEGKLNFLVGSDEETYEAIKPVLSACGQSVLRFGPAGAGAIYKLVNNMMAAIHIAALGEGMALAEKAGLDPRVVAQAIGTHAAASPVVKMKLPMVEKRDHTDTHFALRWMHKDVSYAMKLADEAGVALPTSALVRELLRMAMQRGFADQDLSALTEVVRS